MHGFLPTLPEIGLEEIRDALAAKQERMKYNHDSKLANKSEPEIFPIGSLVMVQKEDGGPWTHGTIITTTRKSIICNHIELSYLFQDMSLPEIQST